MQWVNKLSKAGTNLNAVLKGMHSKHAKNIAVLNTLEPIQFLVTVSLHKCFAASRRHNFVVNSVPLEQICGLEHHWWSCCVGTPLYWLAGWLSVGPTYTAGHGAACPRGSLLSAYVCTRCWRGAIVLLWFLLMFQFNRLGKALVYFWHLRHLARGAFSGHS